MIICCQEWTVQSGVESYRWPSLQVAHKTSITLFTPLILSVKAVVVFVLGLLHGLSNNVGVALFVRFDILCTQVPQKSFHCLQLLLV